MVYFKDLCENEESHLCVVPDSKTRAEDAVHKFSVHPSLLRPDPDVRKMNFPKEMTTSFDKAHARPTYVLTSTLKAVEEESGWHRPFLFGREIILKGARWGPKLLKFAGEFTPLPSYWEWTEDVIARCTARLKSANLHDAVYASLYSYDHDPNVVRAFCESWCPKTNTLHTEAGEWSISLWDLERLGGLSASGHLYDETMPNTAALNARDKNNKRLIPREFGHLLGVYCSLKDRRAPEEGVSAMQWIQFWCKSRREKYYGVPPRKRPREANVRSKSTHNPSGEISLPTLSWTPEEVEVFTQLRIVDASEQKSTYLAAYLSCWLCVFVLPKNDLRLIRPETFEAAARMANGERFSMAVPVLASIYHGLNKLVKAKRPLVSASMFPAHYLYGWLAHYFCTHHDLPGALLGPLMAQYSGHRGAKIYDAVEARKLVHSGASFKAASLLLARNKCVTVCDDNTLDSLTVSYIFSLRTAYLPLRFGASFHLEPYHPTRFARQFGFYQEVPGVLPCLPENGELPCDIALKHLKTLVCKGSQTRVTLPGYLSDWASFASPAFVSWWRTITVTDLRENVQTLVSSAAAKVTKRVAGVTLAVSAPRQKGVIVHSGKRACNDIAVGAANKRRHAADKAMQVYNDLFGAPPHSPERPIRGVPCSHVPEEEVSKAPLLESAMAMPCSSRGSSTPSAAFCARGSPVESEGEDAAMDITSPLPQSRPDPEEDDFTRSMADLVKDHWLKKLIDTIPEKVEAFVAESSVFFESIRSFGGDASSFRTKVDAYVSRVQACFAARGDVVIDEDLIDRTIFKTERNFKSIQITLRDARLDLEGQEQRLSSIAEERAKFKALLQALDEEEMCVVCRQSQKIEEISALESKARILEQQQADLKTSKLKIEHLKGLERELEMMKTDLRAASI